MRISNGIQNRNRRMRNRTYGGVRGRKTKVGRKLLRFPPTRLLYMVLILVVALGFNRGSMEGTAAHTAATKTLMEA